MQALSGSWGSWYRSEILLKTLAHQSHGVNRTHCHGLNCGLPKDTWSSKPWYLRMWPYLETGSVQIELILFDWWPLRREESQSQACREERWCDSTRRRRPGVKVPLTGWMHLQAKKRKDCRLLLEAREGKEGLLPKDFRGSTALLTPQFWTLLFQNCKRRNFCCFKLPTLWYFVTVALGTNMQHTPTLSLPFYNKSNCRCPVRLLEQCSSWVKNCVSAVGSWSLCRSSLAECVIPTSRNRWALVGEAAKGWHYWSPACFMYIPPQKWKMSGLVGIWRH